MVASIARESGSVNEAKGPPETKPEPFLAQVGLIGHGDWSSALLAVSTPAAGQFCSAGVGLSAIAGLARTTLRGGPPARPILWSVLPQFTRLLESAATLRTQNTRASL